MTERGCDHSQPRQALRGTICPSCLCKSHGDGFSGSWSTGHSALGTHELPTQKCQLSVFSLETVMWVAGTTDRNF